MFTEAQLAQFTGSERLHQHPLCANVAYSDGAAFVTRNGGAWLVDKIACLLQLHKGLKAALAANPAMTGLHFWYLKLDGTKAMLNCAADDGVPPIYSEEIAFTDCPFDVTLYVAKSAWINPNEQQVSGWHIFLPSEY